MSQVIIHVLCEGQTEDCFVADCLSPFLQARGLVVKHQILVTNRRKHAEGGLVSFQMAKNDLERMFRQFPDTGYEQHWFTTMFDLYALPTDFPGHNLGSGSPYDRVEALETAFAQSVKHPLGRFIPYIQLHEFEALVLDCLEYLKDLYPSKQKAIENLREDCREFDSPELVDGGVTTAPSKRLISALGTYNKVLAGPTVTAMKGIDRLCCDCRHFGQWVERLGSLVG